MTSNKSFFIVENPKDPVYKDVKNNPTCKKFIEDLWDIYECYNNDKHFLSDAGDHFHQRFWEMYLCVTMLKQGFTIEKGKSKGPDFSINIGNRKIWIEAIVPTAGQTDSPDRVPEPIMFQANFTRVEKILLRYTSALSEKNKQYKKHCDNKIIAKDDLYIVAINSSQIPHASCGSTLPYHIQAFLPIGSPTVRINPKTLETSFSHQYREAIKKDNGNSVSTNAFYDPEYSGISAVIHSIFDVARYCYGSTGWGSDFEVLHNPSATNPLPFELIHWCKYRYLLDGQLITLNNTSNVHQEPLLNPIQEIFEDQTWLTTADPAKKARDLAAKLLIQLRMETE